MRLMSSKEYQSWETKRAGKNKYSLIRKKMKKGSPGVPEDDRMLV